MAQAPVTNGMTGLQARTNINANDSELYAAKHTQGTDQGLDTGGANEVTAAQAKVASDHVSADGKSHSDVGLANTHRGLTNNPHGVTAAQAGALANVSEDTTPQAGGAFDFQDHGAYFTEQSATGDGTTAWDLRKANRIFFTFGAQDDTWTFSNAPAGATGIACIIKQDSVGGRDLTLPAGTWLTEEPVWADGGANKHISLSIIYSNSTYFYMAGPWEA